MQSAGTFEEDFVFSHEWYSPSQDHNNISSHSYDFGLAAANQADRDR